MQEQDKMFGVNTLFKYYQIPENYKEFSKSVIVKPTIRLKSASSFNDPNEFKFKFLLDKSNMGSIRQEYFSLYPIHSEQDFQEWNLRTETDGFKNFILNDMRNDYMESFKVCSFSEVGNSNLMWSHYADSHKGIAVIYNDLKKHIWDIALKHSTVIKKVIYVNSPADLTLPQPKFGEILEVMCLRKQKEWEYEREVRMICHDESNSNPMSLDINPGAIHGLILGSRTPSEISKYLSSICKEYSFKIYQVELQLDDYKLQIKPI